MNPKAALRLRVGLSLVIDDLRSLNPRDKWVLDRLSRYVDDSGKTRVRQQQLAEEIYVSVSTVRSSLYHLQELGYIAVESQGRSNVYATLGAVSPPRPPGDARRL